MDNLRLLGCLFILISSHAAFADYYKKIDHCDGDTENCCADKEDGTYLVTPDYCENLFIVCRNKMTFKGYCPDGKVYDVKEHCISLQKLKRCAANQEDTEEIESPPIYKPKLEQIPLDVSESSSYGDERVPVPSAPRDYYHERVPVPSAPKDYYQKYKPVASDEEETGDAECEDNGDFPDPTEPCADHYYSCIGGKYIERPCAPGTMYDSDSGRCDHREFIRACGGQPTPPPPPTPRPPPRDENVGPKIDCSGLGDGDHVDPYYQCSGTYYSCTGLDSVLRECPSGLVFDPDSGACDHQEYVRVCGGYPAPPTYEPAYDMPESAYDCSGLKDGEYYPDPVNYCSYYYYSCVGGYGRQHSCPTEALRYDPELGRCELEAHVPVCGGQRPPPSPAVESNPIEIDTSYSCEGLTAGNHAGDICAPYYWSCSEGAQYGVRVPCPPSTYYDELYDECAFYDDVYSCSGHYRVIPAPMDETAPVPPYPFDCPSKGNFPEPDYPCSSKFVACSGAGYTGSLMRCASGLKYDAELDACYSKSEVPACGGQRPTPKPADAIPPTYDSYYRPAPQDTPVVDQYYKKPVPQRQPFGGYKPNAPYRRRRGADYKSPSSP